MAKNDSVRGAGRSVAQVGGRGRTRMPFSRIGHHLNGPVIVTQPGKPTRTLYDVDGRRYASRKLRRMILERDGYRCRYCQVSVTNASANIDSLVKTRFEEVPAI